MFPEENGCAPGDHFRADQRAEAERFAAYGGVDFRAPIRQRFANGLSAVGLAGAAGCIVACAARGASRRRAGS